MARLASVAEAGFFPTPPHLLPAIAAQVEPSQYRGGVLLDLFCGAGEAAAFLGNAWELETVGVELNPARAQAARSVLTRTICSDAFQVIGAHDQFDAALHNPPYQESLDGSRQRLEYKATLAVTPYIRPGGLLVAILPDYRVANQKFAGFLTANYQVERVFRFPHPDYDAFRQVVIYARKRREQRKNPNAALALIERLQAEPPTLPEACDVSLRLLATPHGKKKVIFRGRELDREAMLLEMGQFKWSGADAFSKLATPHEAQRAGRPAMPLKIRHLGQFIAAAIMNNVVLAQDGPSASLRACPEPVEGAGYHIICGRTRKSQAEAEQPTEDDDEPQTRVWEEFSTECRAFNPHTGEFLEFTEDNAGEFREYIHAWRPQLVQAVKDAYPPLYNFDFRETFHGWLVEYIDHYVAQRATIDGRAGSGLFEGQKHALAASICKLLETGASGRQRDFFINAFHMGFGKTMLAAATYGALVRLWAHQTGRQASSATGPVTSTLPSVAVNALSAVEEPAPSVNSEPALNAVKGQALRPKEAPKGWPPAVFVTEPTLLEQTAAEIRKADPFLRAHIVRNVREVDLFLAEAHSAPWPMVMVVPRTAAKDGFGWRPAVVPRRRGRYEKSREGGEQLVIETLYACPTCGESQREPDKDSDPALWPLAREFEYFQEERRTCSNLECQAPLWQDFRRVGGMVAGSEYRPEYWECLQHWENDRIRLQGAASEGDALACKSVFETRCFGAAGEFKLARGDRVHRHGEMLFARRDGRPVAMFDLGSSDVTTDPDAFEYIAPAPGQRIWRVPGDRRELATPPMARLPVAEYLARLAERGERFLLCIVDEVQKFKSSDTNAGYALGNLMRVADKTLALTGTLYSGYASDMFPILYRTDPAFRASWPYRGKRDFVARYGLLEWIERRRSNKEDDDDTLGYSQLSGYRRRRESVRELPAISPELTAFLLDRALFLGLQDLGFEMVTRTERPQAVTPEDDFRQAYEDFLRDAVDAFKAAKEEEIHIGGAFLHAMLSYSAAPWRRTEIRDRKTNTLWAWAPDLEIVCKHCGRTLFKARHCRHCHPEETPQQCLAHGCGEKRRRVFRKEQALLDNLSAAKAAGRTAVVFAIHTNRLDLITPRWTGTSGLCEQVGLKAVNGNIWSSNKRMAQLERAVLDGADVVFINPMQVETGMNLVWFPDIHWYQMSYSLFLIEQASARSWRPTQTQDVDIHFYCADGTYEERALARVMKKRIARLTMRGDEIDATVQQASGVGEAGLLHQIIEDVAAAETTDLSSLFAEYNRLAAETVMRPSEFITDNGANFVVEARDGRNGSHALDALERQLEAALVQSATPQPTAPMQQMALFE